MGKYITSKLPILFTSVMLSLVLCLLLSHLDGGIALKEFPLFWGMLTACCYFIINMTWKIVADFIKLTSVDKKQYIVAFIAVIIGLKLSDVIHKRLDIPPALTFLVFVIAAVAVCIIYVKLKRKNILAVTMLGQYITEDNLDIAIEKFEELKGKKKINLFNRGFSYYHMYICYLYKGDTEKARHIFSQAERSIKNINGKFDIKHHLLMWKAYEKLLDGEYEECLEYLDKTILFAEKHPQAEDSEVYKLVAGSLYAVRGKADEAMNLLIPLKTFSQSPVIQNRAQEALNRLKEDTIPKL